MGIGSLRDRSARYSGSARGLRKAWQSARSCEAASTNPALRILAAHIRTPRLGMAVAGSRDRSTPYSGSARGLRRAWQSARSCKAASTHRSVRLSAGHIRALRLGVAEAMLRLQSAPYSGSLRGLGRAWQSVRSCEAASTTPSLRLSVAHTPLPTHLRQEASSGEQNAPRPEHAKRAIWAGQAARSCEAASTDWGWASNSGSAAGEDLELDRLLEEARGVGRDVAGEYY